MQTTQTFNYSKKFLHVLILAFQPKKMFEDMLITIQKQMCMVQNILSTKNITRIVIIIRINLSSFSSFVHHLLI